MPRRISRAEKVRSAGEASSWRMEPALRASLESVEPKVPEP